MKTYLKMMLSVFSLLPLIIVLTVFTLPVVAADSLVWHETVLSSGVELTSSVLEAGKLYRIVVKETFSYNYSYKLYADAQYYTTDNSSDWDWGNHFPAPGGHSILQINGEDVYWGPFSNGDTGHTYTIDYVGEGSAITFRIVDWIDGDYTNNDCHLAVWIYDKVVVGGYVLESNPWQIVTLMIGALMLVVVVTVPTVRHYTKTVVE